MALSDAEKEKIVEVETFRDDVQKALQPVHGPTEGRLSRFFQQQAVLLVLGFVLTAGLGSWLTYFWKERDWKNQQNYLSAQRALDKKYAVIDKTFKEVAVTTAAAEDILATHYGTWTAKEVQERRDNWNTTSRNWRVASKVLSENIAASFSNPKIQSTFEGIVVKRKQLGNKITNLLRPGLKIPEIDQDKAYQEGNDMAVDITKRLRECGGLMTAEIKVAPRKEN
jgi:hypothetical protein